MDFTWKPITPTPRIRANSSYPNPNPTASLSRTPSQCASTQPASPPQPSPSPHSLPLPKSPCSSPCSSPISKPTNLLDLPVHLLHRILLFTLPSHKSLPLPLPAFATTNRYLRRVTSTLLPSDHLWTEPTPVSYQHLLPTCAHLSYNLLDPYHPREPYEFCPNPHCAPLHRQIAWYTLSAPGLRSLSLAHILRTFPTREAALILRRLTAAKPCLQHININLEQLTNDGIHLDVLLPTLCRLFKTVCSHIQVLELCMMDTTLSEKLLNVCVLSQPLPMVNTLVFSLPALSARSWDIVERSIKKMLKHCLKSGAQVKALEFDLPPGYVNRLGMFASFCPYVDNVLVKGLITERRCVANVKGLSLFNAKQIVLEGLQIDAADLSLLLEQTDVGEGRLESIGFVDCMMQGVWEVLRGDDGKRLGSMMKRLEVGEKINSGTLELVARNCEGLELLSFWCDGQCLGVVDVMMKKLGRLKGMRMKVLGTYEWNDMEFGKAVETGGCALEILEMEGVMMTMDKVCEALCKFRESLRRFRVCEIGKKLGLCEVECLFKGIVNMGGLERLECLQVLLQCKSVRCADVEEDVMMQRVRMIIEQVRVCCPRLDLTTFENWINDFD